MSKVLDQALEELDKLPAEAREAIAHDLLDLVRSEAKWDRLFVDPRSAGVLRTLAAEADAEGCGPRLSDRVEQR